ncbi:MAG: translation initiation factor IF-2 [Phycisphaerae bacterium]|nr:translation initiation factor IF-2 [Phycisphaerae bacterium]
MIKKAALKVHQLAKELGVNSKDIVARCKSEEIEGIENHLSPVSAGLAATIREWFGGGAGAAPATATATEAPPEPAPAPKAAPPAPSNAASTSTVDGKAHRKPAKPASEGGERPAAPRSTRVSPAPSAPGAPAPSSAPAPSAPSVETVRPVMPSPAPRTPSHQETHTPTARPEAPRVAARVDHPAETRAPEPREARPADTRPPESRPTEAPRVARPEVRPEARAEVRTPSRPDARPDARPEARSEPRPDARAESRPDARPEGRADARPAPRAESKAPTRPEARPEGRATADYRTQDSRADSRPDTSSSGDASGNEPNFAPYVAPTMNVPKRPDIVKPVGPRLENPTKTVMSGPKVIRIEAPEQLPTPRPRSATGGTGGPVRVNRPGAGPVGRDDRNRGGRGATPGRRDDPTGRSGRLARAGGTPGEPWRPQDLREREDRLSRSDGFFKTHKRDSLRPRGPGGPGQQRPAGRDESAPVHIAEPLTIKDLSAATGVKATDILKRLFLGGTVMNINSAIDRETAVEVMMDFDIELIVEESKSAAEIIESRFEEREAVDARPRAPVVTILGHVDHGKTSLLDRIRNANVASGEAGGITQKTSAFTVPVHAGDKDRVVTFIDTPGHEAFTNMRSRGAKVTDVAVLVIAADDGVMPQTIESIAHARAAEVPIVVALNKMDKPEATESNIRRILGQLAEHELNPVEWGGTTEVVRTSATKGEGIQDLLDILDYQADLLGLTADFGGSARGTVLEAKMEEGRGPVANVLVQEGTIKKGDFIVVGRGFGRVRDLVNDRGQRVTEAGPSTPVAISGIDLLPDAGDKFFVVDSLKAAEEAAEERRRLDRERELAAPKVTLDSFFATLEKGKKKELALVVKADSQGSVEALRAELSKIGTEEVQVVVKHCAVGGINENDVMLAVATKATIVGFNVTSSSKARQLAETKGTEIRLYDVIYDLKDDVTKAASGLLAPEIKLEVLGHAEVRQVFKISKVGMIAGCYVQDGVIERNAQIRVTRNGIVIEKDRRLEQLKRFKDDAKEVRAGQECGMKIVGYDDIKSGDILECYKTVQVARSL